MSSEKFIIDIKRVTAKLNLGQLTDLLVAEARECAYVRSAPGSGPVGGSRLGGIPDLPTGVAWPRGCDEAGAGDRYADFLAQIDLADIPPIQRLSLPRKGRVRLFMTTPLRDVTDIAFTAITDSSDVVALQPRPVPTDREPVDGRLIRGATALRFELGVNFPTARPDFRDTVEEILDEPAEELAAEFQPEDCRGIVGGYAFDYEGNDLRVVPAINALGRNDLKDEASAGLKHPWLDEHREEIAMEMDAWKLLISFWPSMGRVDFDVSDSYPLWIFVRSPADVIYNFEDICAVGSP